MNIWDFQNRLTNRLFVWASSSIIIGLILILSPKRVLKGMGIQFIGWGFVDFLIGYVGKKNAARKRKLDNHQDSVIVKKETENLIRILIINSIADIFYIITGLFIINKKGKSDPFWAGHGIGVLIQGAFLFLFDFVHAKHIQDTAIQSYLDTNDFDKQPSF